MGIRFKTHPLLQISLPSGPETEVLICLLLTDLMEWMWQGREWPYTIVRIDTITRIVSERKCRNHLTSARETPALLLIKAVIWAPSTSGDGDRFFFFFERVAANCRKNAALLLQRPQAQLSSEHLHAWCPCGCEGWHGSSQFMFSEIKIQTLCPLQKSLTSGIFHSQEWADGRNLP